MFDPQSKGDADVSISATGERQLTFKLTTQSSHFDRLPVQHVLCSPMRRALRTALAAYPKQCIVVEPRLRELGATGGMLREELRAFVAEIWPQGAGNVDLGRVPCEMPWWGPETRENVRQRLQAVLEEVRGHNMAGRVVALVGHSLAMQCMVGYPVKPFPASWGTPRGWPNNFKPYFAALACSSESSDIRVVAAPIETATLVLLRHAHSEAQAARRAEKQEKRKNDSLDMASPQVGSDSVCVADAFKVLHGDASCAVGAAQVAIIDLDDDSEEEGYEKSIASTRGAKADDWPLVIEIDD